MDEQSPRCAATGCNRRARTDGLCAMHYWQRAEGVAEAGVIPARPQSARACSIEGCERVPDTAGLCTMHYSRKLNGNANWDDPNPWHLPNDAAQSCLVEGCERRRKVKGLCNLHYGRKWRGVQDWDSLEPARPGRKRAVGICAVDRCGVPIRTKGLCELHYNRKLRGVKDWDSLAPAWELRRLGECPNGHLQTAVNTEAAPDGTRRCRKCRVAEQRRLRDERDPACMIEGCERPRRARGSDLCAMHYARKLVAHPNWDEPGELPGRLPTTKRCFNGHLLTPENTYTAPSGRTHCRVCRRKRMAKSRATGSLKMEITEDMHGGATAWRYGCRCDDCRRHHSQKSQELRWTAKFGPGGPMGPEVRERVLASLKQTRNVARTAEELGIKHQAIYGAVRAVPGFGILVDQLTAGRPAGRDG